MFYFSLFLWMGTMFPFFHSEGKTPVRRACLKIISGGTQIESPHIFSMRILMLSCSWALFKSRFWMNFPISLSENVTVEWRLSVISLISAGRELLLGIREHCLEKKKTAKFDFFLKICYKTIFVKQWGIKGIFLLFNKFFNREYFRIL